MAGMATESDSARAATFYFDLGSPFAYLTAERIGRTIAAPVRWQPVSLGALFKLSGRSSWSLAGPESRRQGIAEVQRRASRYGLPPLRWPEPWPGNYLMAMRAAVVAQQAGCVERFALCAFRNAFQSAHDLSDPARVLQAAADAGLDPQEVERATREERVKLALREATDEAHRLGVFGVPTIAVAEKLFWGDDTLEEAAAAYLGTSRQPPHVPITPY